MIYSIVNTDRFASHPKWISPTVLQKSFKLTSEFLLFCMFSPTRLSSFLYLCSASSGSRAWHKGSLSESEWSNPSNRLGGQWTVRMGGRRIHRRIHIIMLAPDRSDWGLDFLDPSEEPYEMCIRKIHFRGKQEELIVWSLPSTGPSSALRCIIQLTPITVYVHTELLPTVLGAGGRGRCSLVLPACGQLNPIQGRAQTLKWCVRKSDMHSCYEMTQITNLSSVSAEK